MTCTTTTTISPRAEVLLILTLYLSRLLVVVVAAQADGCGFDEAAYRHQPHILPFSSTVDLLSLEAARSTSEEE